MDNRHKLPTLNSYKNTGNNASKVTAVEKAFIKLYKNLPNLWNTNHPDYNNRALRNASYDELLKILRRLMPQANRYHVRQKINIFRSCYRKDLRKHLASRTILPDGKVEYTYVPTIWKFHALRFLDQHGETSPEMCEDEEEEQEVEYLRVNDQESMHEEEVYTSNLEIPDIYVEEQESSKHRFDQSLSRENVLEKELNAIGDNVSCKLSRMSDSQRYRAELLINKVLIYGLKDKLTDDTDLTDVWRVEEDFSSNSDKEAFKQDNDGTPMLNYSNEVLS